MKLPGFIKKGIMGFTRKFGYEIIKTNNQNTKWTHIGNPVEHNSKNGMDTFYKREGLLTEYMDHERIEFYKEVVELIKQKVKFSNDKTIADAGCGTGHLLYFLKEQVEFEKATGFDFSPEAIKMAKELFPSFEFYVFDIYSGQDQKFDIVLCTEVLEHLLHPDLALSNLLSMLNPDGSLFITVPNGRLDTFKGHINFWSPESWEIFIKKNATGYETGTGTVQNDQVNFALIKNRREN